MVKKRKKVKVIKKTVKKKRVKTVKKNLKRFKVKSYSKTADVLLIIAEAILVISALSLIFFKNQVLEALKGINSQISPSSIVWIGLIWLLIAFLSWSLNKTIKEKQKKVSMWELFILAIVAAAFGRIESGILMLIASIIYLVKTKKK